MLDELADGVVDAGAFDPLTFFLPAEAFEAGAASLPEGFSFLGPRLAGVFLVAAFLAAGSLAVVVAPLGRPTEAFLGAVALVTEGDVF